MGMQVGPGNKGKGSTPDINVTPLVDVVLVLLIIFMIITPQMDNKVPVELQSIENPDEGPKSKIEPIEITIAKNGKLFLEQDELTEEALKEHLETEHKTNPRRKVVIRADKTAKFASARKIFKAAKEIGFPGASLMVGKPGSGGEESSEEAKDG